MHIKIYKSLKILNTPQIDVAPKLELKASDKTSIWGVLFIDMLLFLFSYNT